MSSPEKMVSGGRRLRRGALLPLVVLIAAGVQVPAVLALGHVTGQLSLVIVGAAALTGAFLTSFGGPRSVWGSPSRARLFLVMWPFFMWWTVSLMSVLLAPLALAARFIFLVSTAPVLAAWMGLAGICAAVTLWQRPRIRRYVVDVEGLPELFEGYRLAQISDLHCGPFASGPRVLRWVSTVNAQDADLIAVTGDLIASGAAFVPVVASALGGLRARDGVFASMGNHDYFTDGESLVTALEGHGVTVLRNRGVDIVRGSSAIHVAGADDTWSKRADMDRTLAGRRPETPVVLLAHDPELFLDAVDRGVALTLSGHTHGGQLGLPLFARKLNLARLMTPFTTGFYRVGQATLYVNRGLGTTGPPVRLGVPPEIAVFTLRRAVPATVKELNPSRRPLVGDPVPASARG
ncbi:MAG: metallophosphoesterase [Deltaproteobacteria bacterium]|nr:metallophosphoesterase [Deltaproteobacteria bacterium]